METTTKTLWKIDPTHSEVQFKVKHLVISTVTGSFRTFEGSLETEGEDFENASASFAADIESISTNNADRDNHLKSGDFFNADDHPQLTFSSDTFRKVSEDQYKVTGDLAIRGVTRQIELDVVYGGTVQDPYGNTKAGFEITGSINRKDYELNWNAVTEAGNIVVGDTVRLQLNVQFTQEQEG